MSRAMVFSTGSVSSVDECFFEDDEYEEEEEPSSPDSR